MAPKQVAAAPKAGAATEERLEIGDVDPVDEFCLASIFDEATTFLSSSSAKALKLTDAQKLRFYALFKQATVGPCNTPKPGLLEFVAKAKWQAWKDLGAMGKDAAVATYVADLERLAPSWHELAAKQAAADGKDKKAGGKDGDDDGGGGGGGGGGMGLGSLTSRPVYDDPDGDLKDSEKTVTYYASVNDLATVRALISGAGGRKPVDVNTRDAEGRSALLWAADRGHTDMVRALLREFKADVTLRDGEGQTALHYACTCEYDAIAADLLAAGADRNAKDESGETPAAIAADSGNKKLKAVFAAAAAGSAAAPAPAASTTATATATAAASK